MGILMPKPIHKKRAFFKKLVISTLSLIVVISAIAVISRKDQIINKVTKVAGEVAGVSIVNGSKFLGVTIDPTSALAATTPYQDVAGDVNISGKVGIGIVSPGTKLDVNGPTRSSGFVATAYDTTNWSGIGAEVGMINNNAYFSGYNRPSSGYVNTFLRGSNIYLQNNGATHFTLDTNGNVTITGSLTATSKSFEIDHPAKPGYRLVHSSLEGPEVGVYYRGESRLIQGKATIMLPDYFEALTQKGNRTVLLTPKFDDDEPISNLAASAISNGKFSVRAIDNSNNSQKFYWEVKAVRSDIPSLTVEKPADQNK